MPLPLVSVSRIALVRRIYILHIARDSGYSHDDLGLGRADSL
jgi:hypothetical protein